MRRVIPFVLVNCIGCVASPTSHDSPDAGTTPDAPDPGGSIALKLGQTALTDFDFGSVVVGGYGPVLVITVVNETQAPTGVLNLQIAGVNPTDFEIDSASDCTGNTILAPGATCNVRLGFDPTALASRAAMFSVTANPGGSSALNLTGTGVAAPTLVVSPPYHDFSVIQFGHPQTQAFTLTNNGASVDLTSLAVTQGLGTGFSLASSNCPTTLASGASCDLTVKFDPTTFGQDNADLTLTTSAGVITQGANWIMGYGGARLSVFTTGTGHGYIVSDGGGVPSIDCGSTCSGLFMTSQHTLTASSTTDTFFGWDQPSCGTSPTCTITLGTGVTQIVADFE